MTEGTALADTNILIRFVTDDPPDQAEAVARLILEQAREGERLVVLPTALMETEFVLKTQYGIHRDQAMAALESIVNHITFVVLDRQQVIDALLICRKHRSLSFADAYHCAMARRHCNGNLVSFDRKLSGVDGVTRIEPGAAPN